MLNWKAWLRTHIWSIFYVLALVAILALSVRGLLRVREAWAAAQAVPASGTGQGSYTIIIDPGHGGVDGGAVGVTGAREAEINLSISRKLRQILALCGVSAVMTRTDENALEAPEADTIAAKKVTDIKNRVALINGVENGLLVSIHQNMFSQSRYTGAQVFWAPTAGSQELAEYTQEVLRRTLAPDNHRMAKPVAESIYLMNHIQCTGMLVECGFLSNPGEEALLQQDGYQTRVAAAIAGALLGWQAGERTT